MSPILGAFFLTELDDALAQLGLFAIRFMDDILVLAPTKWKLRKAVQVVNQVLTSLRLQKHPDKTFIGRCAKGFDWLGYHIRPGLVTVAKTTVAHHVARRTRLYEQKPRAEASSRLGDYVRRWQCWVASGLQTFGAFLRMPADEPVAWHSRGVRGLRS